jgi:hypothetical protein
MRKFLKTLAVFAIAIAPFQLLPTVSTHTILGVELFIGGVVAFIELDND